MLGSVFRSRNQEVGALQQVADWVSRSVERTRQRSTTLRFLHPEAHDQLVGVGESFELTTEVSALSNLTAESVRFFIGDRALGDVPIEAGAAYLVTKLDEPGVVRARHEAIGAGGQVLRRGREVVIQVVDARPVVLLDADVVYGDPSAFRYLRRLAELDVNVAWVDLSPAPRAFDLRERLGRHAVPIDAVLSHPREANEVTSLSVFLRTIVRRLRASGVAVVAFISGTPEQFVHRAGDEIEIVAPPAIPVWLRDISWRARVGAEARELHERRASSDRFEFRLDESTRTRSCSGNQCAVDCDNRSSRKAIFDAICLIRHGIG